VTVANKGCTESTVTVIPVDSVAQEYTSGRYPPPYEEYASNITVDSHADTEPGPEIRATGATGLVGGEMTMDPSKAGDSPSRDRITGLVLRDENALTVPSDEGQTVRVYRSPENSQTAAWPKIIKLSSLKSVWQETGSGYCTA
jgi:hypothetical protein